MRLKIHNKEKMEIEHWTITYKNECLDVVTCIKFGYYSHIIIDTCTNFHKNKFSMFHKICIYMFNIYPQMILNYTPY